ncbi:MAG: hypothetical protein LBM25_05760 [Bacteroidales bacterium]|jgi:hypothetical protein|nr:hypothetical protein [Bacteroidales bacterium]
MKNTLLFSFLLLIFALSFSSCQEDDTLPSSWWNGTWQIDQEIVFPQTKNINLKSYQGTIQISTKAKRNIIISGSLFGLNSSFSIEATVVSTNATIDSNIGGYRIKGSAIIEDKDNITFSITITSENQDVKSYTLKAIRVK